MTGKRRLTRDAARASAYFEVEFPDDVSFRCRVVSALEMFAAGVLPPPLLDEKLAPEERVAARKASAERGADAILTNTTVADTLLALSMVEPKLWLGPYGDCPADAIPASDLGAYRDDLIREVMGHVGYEEDRRKAVAFCDREGTGTPADSSGALSGA